jgi:hypothetical protein
MDRLTGDVLVRLERIYKLLPKHPESDTEFERSETRRLYELVKEKQSPLDELVK